VMLDCSPSNAVYSPARGVMFIEPVLINPVSSVRSAMLPVLHISLLKSLG